MPNLHLLTVFSEGDKLINNEGSTREFNVISNGTVTIISNIMVDLFCEPRVQKYPFDVQECFISVWCQIDLNHRSI